MKLPLHLTFNGMGLLADLCDREGQLVASCVEEEDARLLLNAVNGRVALLDELRLAREESEDLRRFLHRFRNSTGWHEERKRRMRSETEKAGEG
jgi:hypothetical protein